MDLDSVLSPLAPRPDGNGFVALRIGRERVQQLAKLSRRTPLFELLYNVCGVVPPVNNIGYHEQNDPPFQDGWGGLKRAHTIFRGVRRPLNGDGIDGTVYVYVVSPLYTYRQVSHMACPAKRFPAPAGTVFTAYVVFDDDQCSAGEIRNWEFVFADKVNPRYPEDYINRYEEKVWENG